MPDSASELNGASLLGLLEGWRSGARQGCPPFPLPLKVWNAAVPIRLLRILLPHKDTGLLSAIL